MSAYRAIADAPARRRRLVDALDPTADRVGASTVWCPALLAFVCATIDDYANGCDYRDSTLVSTTMNPDADNPDADNT
jgi:hypothetical protein